MKLIRLRAMIPMLIFVLTACGAPANPPPTETPTAATTEAPATEAATPESASEPTTAPAAEATLSFTPATYVDESAGFELDYPAEWTLDPSSQIGVRGAQALLLSPGTTLETLAEGGTRIGITTYLWDPKNDLDAYLAQRKVAWDASGFPILREEAVQLAGGRPAHIVVIQSPDVESFNLLTTVGEDYLQISGEGDLALAEEIARTLRPIE